ncbi:MULTISPECIES: DUF2599 domain-containing protein [unclassified Microbacterium]|uniref:DUF2599 domain-containing protein n=1 Tax=unclassified Microbacterium TaxID=2609290 RepID=UPI00214C4C1D|nr:MULTISPECIES: DUF2599 domain-containing protein [unclassified Microbacterium]MCR2782987.1 DUF2599 domain-containing protein [Microbacterium sp. zg.B96]MDL5352241.1 DUF2599 domain-containing protein [Microbacterium sp. zg-YB36]WIM16126.1 DUF2599 domain-containing protein [Microbacterium sp. zg-B96]
MSAPIQSPPLTDDLRLQEYLEPLLQSATRRQLWLFFLDADDRLDGPVLPVGELPGDPAVVVQVDDFGDGPFADVLGARLSLLMRELEFAQIVLVWERPGGAKVRAEERAWGRALGGALRANGARVRAQFVLHDRGMQIIAPDDLM